MAQGGLPPHSHLPAVQLFERMSHATHAAPLFPQAVIAGVVQIDPWQHPPGQLAASHTTHTPPVQRWFPLQATPLPHPHLPAVQVSLVIGSHAAHCAPALPHAVTLGTVHTLFAQQPFGQVAGEHGGATQLPPTHCLPPVHAGLAPHRHAPIAQVSAVFESHIAQTEPPVPHAPTVGVTQASPAQQPVAHEVASHTHAPPTQRVPAPHASPAPHAHLPSVQRSAVVGLHALHAKPGLPQVASDCPEHTSPAQQPVVHVAASQTHAPATHR